MLKARKMLGDWESPYIQSLIRLIETQSKATLRLGRLDQSAPQGIVSDLRFTER